MRTAPVLLRSLAVLLLSAGSSFAGAISARDALRTAGRERGAAYLTRIVLVTGENGADQPAAWRMVASDADGTLREFFINESGVIAEGPLPPKAAASANSPLLSLKSVAFDSTLAFSRAEAAAKAARIGFHSVHYRLQSPARASSPVWFLVLNDALGRKTGEVTVSASSGKILATQWFSTTAAASNPSQQPSSQAEELWYRTRDVAGRSASAVKDSLNRASSWIRTKVSPSTAPAPSPYYVPPRSPRP